MVLILGSDTVLGKSIQSVFETVSPCAVIQSQDERIHDNLYLEQIIEDEAVTEVINCFQYKKINDSEYWREAAYNLNSFFVKNLSGICAKHKSLLIHFSTSYVFDGMKGAPYNEDDDTVPVSVYGDSRLLGETFIRERGSEHLIIRVPDIYGRGVTILDEIFKRIKTYNSINVVKDQYISPTNSNDAASAALSLIQKGARGLFHFAQEGYLSAAAFINETMEIYRNVTGNALSFEVIEKPHEEYLIVADRPLFNVLECGKYSEYTGMPVRNWKDALTEYITDVGEEL